MKEKRENYFKRKHAERQRSKIEKIVLETGQLLPAFRMAYKSGDINIFVSFIEENKLQETFIENSLDDLLKLPNKDEKEDNCFKRIIIKEGLPVLRKAYGEVVYEKIKKLYDEGKINCLDISQISLINRKDNVKQQADIIGKILDLYNDNSLTIGIHRTGGWSENCGKIINEEGLNLTGHSSSGSDSGNYTDIMSKLEENISFDKSPGSLMRQIATGGNYKNYLSRKFVDIAIIAIPNEEFEKENQQIILNNGIQPILNPKFVKGYITVDTENSTLEQYVENPKYIVKSQSKENEEKFIISNKTELWLETLKNCEKISKQSKYVRIKEKLSSIFKNLSPKNKFNEVNKKVTNEDNNPKRYDDTGER